MTKVLILGGGMAGLVSSIVLARAGIECALFERKQYPFQRVCGEYLSAEAEPFLRSLDLFPDSLEPPRISRFMFTSVSGKAQVMPLDLGGFGISRFSFDDYLFKKALGAGVKIFLNTAVENVVFSGHSFVVKTKDNEYEAELVLGAFGKRSTLDTRLDRVFARKRSPYIGVKHHLRMNHPADLIALHNFPGGYCGINRIEHDQVNLCFLAQRDKLREHKTIQELEKNVVCVNPYLREVYSGADFLFEKPEVISEISFATKTTVEDHVLMIGDAAGMITPLCGNGMAMAIHSAKIAGELAVRYFREKDYSRQQLEKDYTTVWNHQFSRRLWFGRTIQKLFGSEAASIAAVNLAIYMSPVVRAMIRNTHGAPF
jgi:menaquinone-9 beta-reductase